MIQQQTNLVEVRGVSFSRGDRQIFALSFCKAIVRLTLTGYHRTLLFTPDP